ncbi:hypothetical protein LOC50_03685 [Pseudoalteromonas sp. SCSIO 43095]|uniref:hypothetical protein n=1 Tax=unclassified Pseudoalteromonas TaxID=194690 RepID=UPI00202AF49C|nr:hypothetical protein [Pseudoalteromonas sp. SCSIO 43095]URQ99425.1 hypothetical protein LOC50_03685 [Pseudoalteromonas sp. SCSIO 43095]
MSSILDIRLIEVGYFLSRYGVKEPPSILEASSWKEAYSKFYATFGSDKTEVEFKNSLKNIRDHFDSHLDNKRTGWMSEDSHPQKLSAANQEVFDRLQRLTDTEIWNRIRPLAIKSYDSKIEKKKINKVKESGSRYFSSEFSGKKIIKSKAPIESNVMHGYVVDQLKQFVEKNFKYSAVFNTQKIDLAIEFNGRITSIFEVKTSVDTQSIYTAVGQLFMHGIGIPDINRIVVLPEPLENEATINCLCELGVQIILFSIDNQLCKFKQIKVIE